jgi:hypothetical protein
VSRSARLAREDTLCRESMPAAERRWLSDEWHDQTLELWIEMIAAPSSNMPRAPK